MLWEQRIIKRFDENKKYPICKKGDFMSGRGLSISKRIEWKERDYGL